MEELLSILRGGKGIQIKIISIGRYKLSQKLGNGFSETK